MECIHIKKADIDAATAVPQPQGKTVIEPFRTFAREHKLPFNILEDRASANRAEIHKTKGDLWHVLEGEATFTYGGDLANPEVKKNKDGALDPDELLADGISGGTTVTLHPGDWLWIPAGVPHVHDAKDVARFVVVKIPHT